MILTKISKIIPGVIYQFRLDKDGNMSFPYINESCREIFELEAEEIQKNANKLLSLIHPEDLPEFYRIIKVYSETFTPGKWQFKVILPRGEIRWIEMNFRLEKDAENNIDWYGILIDITDRKQIEIELEKNKIFLHSLLENLPVAVFVKEATELRFVFWNKETENLLGFPQEQVLGKNDYDFFPQSEADFFVSKDREVLNSGKLLDIPEEPVQTPHSGARLLHIKKIPIIDDQGNPQYLLGIAEDITDRKKAELELKLQVERTTEALQKLQQAQLQLIQSEKMSSLGQLVAGIAHEINNPVNFIAGNLSHVNNYVQNLLKLISLYEENTVYEQEEITNFREEIDLDFLKVDVIKILSSLQIGTTRITEIVRSLRNFSRLDEAQIKQVDIHEGIDSSLLILQHRLKSQHNQFIKVYKNYAELPVINCYPGQLNQVFMNILSNAIDVLEEEKSDKFPLITIVTEVINTDWIRIKISDNGGGMSADIKQKLFDPFFTTKPVGKGTGMGMAISYQIIVEKHHGKLYCDSHLGTGTDFLIEIPIK
jgi:two-component system, NtrC family, sensor kinase